MNRHRKAFTLLEILTVVAIIAILLGIVAYGMSKVSTHMKGTAVTATFGNLKSMVAELKATTKGQPRQPGYLYFGTSQIVATAVLPIDIWNDADPNTAGQQAALAPDGNVSLAVASGSTTSPRYVSDGILNTQLVIGLLRQSTLNRQTIEKLPPSTFMEAAPAGTVKPTFAAGTTKFDPPILLDPWGNPIMFVPSGGLYMVTAGDVLHNGTLFTAGAANNPIQSPDHTPFWASAGPDGDFRKGDDNIYSFEE